MEICKEVKRKVKRCICQSKEEVHEQFGMKINQNVNGNRTLFWKEVSKANGGKVESCSRITMEIGGWYWKRLKYERFGRSIMRIFII